MKLKFEDFTFIKESLTQKYGIETNKVTSELMQEALESLAKTNRLTDFNAAVELIKQNSLTSRQLIGQLVEKFVIGETYFFREPKTFELITQDIVPSLKFDQLKILCLACSTGQEVYSLAISLLEGNPNLKFEITGVDVSAGAIVRASMGLYNDFEVQRGLTQDLLNKYFRKNKDGFEIISDVKRRCSFVVDNIINPRSKFAGFHIVLCRNVLIYMSSSTTKKFLDGIPKMVEKGGYFITASTEIIPNLPLNFKLSKHRGFLVNEK